MTAHSEQTPFSGSQQQRAHLSLTFAAGGFWLSAVTAPARKGGGQLVGWLAGWLALKNTGKINRVHLGERRAS